MDDCTTRVEVAVNLKEQPSRTKMALLLGEASVGRYALIGITGVTLDALVFAALVWTGVVPVVATILSTCCGIANNYVLNAKLNFHTPLRLRHAGRFLAVGLAGLAVAAASLELLMRMAGLAALPAKLISLPVVIISQFVANKYWSFRD